MRKIILFLIALPILASCQHLYEQNVEITPKITAELPEIAKKASYNLYVYDNRENKNIIGKRLDKNGATIFGPNNLDILIRDALNQKLRDAGFRYGRSRKINIDINSLNYNAKYNIFFTEYKIRFAVDIQVRDHKNFLLFSDSLISTSTTRTFIAALAKTNQEKINHTVNKVVNNIIESYGFSKAITR